MNCHSCVSVTDLVLEIFKIEANFGSPNTDSTKVEATLLTNEGNLTPSVVKKSEDSLGSPCRCNLINLRYEKIK